MGTHGIRGKVQRASLLIYPSLFAVLSLAKGGLSCDHPYYIRCARVFPYCELHPGYVLPLAVVSKSQPSLVQSFFLAYQILGFALLTYALYRRDILLPAYLNYLAFRAHANLPAYTLSLALFLLIPWLAPFFHTAFAPASFDASWRRKRLALLSLLLALVGALPLILLPGRGGAHEIRPLVQGGWVRALGFLSISSLILIALRLRGLEIPERDLISLAAFFSMLMSPIDVARGV